MLQVFRLKLVLIPKVLRVLIPRLFSFTKTLLPIKPRLVLTVNLHQIFIPILVSILELLWTLKLRIGLIVRPPQLHKLILGFNFGALKDFIPIQHAEWLYFTTRYKCLLITVIVLPLRCRWMTMRVIGFKIGFKWLSIEVITLHYTRSSSVAYSNCAAICLQGGCS